MKTFRGFLLGDEQLLKSIQCYPFITSATSWHFTLPSLHDFLKARANCFYELDYQQFRLKLFHNPINEQLKTLNGKIIIIDNQYKIDASTYALIKTEALTLATNTKMPLHQSLNEEASHTKFKLVNALSQKWQFHLAHSLTTHFAQKYRQ